MKIANVDLKGKGNHLTLHVTAIAPTLGWKNVGLEQIIHIAPPQDGLEQVILVATPPLGPAPTAVEVFELSLHLTTADWFQGVQVKSKNGDIRTVRNPVLKAAPIGNSHFGLSFQGIDSDKLLLEVRYGGGCKEHTFQLSWDGDIIKTSPPEVTLEVTHNNHGDNCMALLTEVLQFDLSTLPGFPQEEMKLTITSPGGSFTVPYIPTVMNTKPITSKA